MDQNTSFNNRLEAIIFDLDGTLWNAMDTCMQSIEYMKNKYTDITKDITKEDVMSAMGKSFEEIADLYYGYLPKEKAISYTRERINKNIELLSKFGGTLYDNTKNTIIELSKKYKLYIVSNCLEGYIEAFLNTSGLSKYFLDYENNGRTGLSKGENIKLVIERNNIKNAIYVGDTISDKKAALFAGIPFVYAEYGFGSVDEYDYIIKDISELKELVR